GFERTVTTNQDGGYAFPTIQPATYRLEVEASGFKKVVNNSLQLAVDSPARFDVTLEAGDVSAVVNVTSGSIETIVNTQDATIGNNFVP
ncbi:carboxypeptidase-like regulatory domain-containing protein, partial [Escherichia coli]|nr:carboxypeptidase-like regulatory domain-containing protein [Escherichia coli]